jgi:hypothetical protein
MIDYHLLIWEQDLAKFEYTRDAIAKQRPLACHQSGEELAATVENVIVLLQACLDQTSYISQAPLRDDTHSILLQSSRIVRVARRHKGDALRVIKRVHDLFNEHACYLSGKIEKQQQYTRWVEENFGIVLNEHFEFDCIVISQYDSENEILHVFFGGNKGDPLGEGHGHYIFTLKDSWPVFARPPHSWSA